MKIYLAARFRRRGELQRYAHELMILGHSVTARWVVGTASDIIGFSETAQIDFEDVRAADLVILFTESPGSSREGRGGRYVEFGLALAWGKQVVIVGPREENVFHHLPHVAVVPDWEEMLKQLRETRAAVSKRAPLLPTRMQ